MAKKVDIILHSDYPPQTCLAKLAEQIDLDRWALFSLSGYKGSKAILGRFEGNEFRLHKRRYWRNSFGPVLFGRMTTWGGSRFPREEAYCPIAGTNSCRRADYNSEPGEKLEFDARHP